MSLSLMGAHEVTLGTEKEFTSPLPTHPSSLRQTRRGGWGRGELEDLLNQVYVEALVDCRRPVIEKEPSPIKLLLALSPAQPWGGF